MSAADDFKAQFSSHYGYQFAPRAPDYKRCAEQIWPAGRAEHPHQCARKNGHGPHGAWCKSHDPVAVKAKGEQRQAAWDAQSERSSRLHAAKNALEPALRKIAAGHNDPRELAREVLDALDKARKP